MMIRLLCINFAKILSFCSTATTLQITMSELENIKAIVRVRPSLNSENRSCLVINDERNISITTNTTAHPQSFCFDHIAGPDTNQHEMMTLIGKPITNQCLDGYNGTIFAYGQTGSGKTYTMKGGDNEASYGLIPNIFHYLFDQMSRKEGNENEYTVQLSCCEIYNKVIIDLLDNSKGNLQIREDAKRSFYVQNLSKTQCDSAKECLKLVDLATSNRQTSSTKMNQHSSRSHLLLSLTISRRQIISVDGTETTKTTKTVKSRTSILNLVDLAGSERQNKTGTKGDRLKEAKYINQSLTELGRVISSIIKKEKHVPFRNSELTKLLKHSLGGNSITFVIANISQSIRDSAETLSTLLFAHRVKQIRNTAKINEDVHSSLESLKADNSRFTRIVEELNAKSKVTELKNLKLIQENESLKTEMEALQQQMETLHIQICENTTESAMISELQNEIKKLEFQVRCTEHIAMQPVHRGSVELDDSLRSDPWIIVSWSNSENRGNDTNFVSHPTLQEERQEDTEWLDHLSTVQLLALLQGNESDALQSVKSAITRRIRASLLDMEKNRRYSFFEEFSAFMRSDWMTIGQSDPPSFVKSIFRDHSVADMSKQESTEIMEGYTIRKSLLADLEKERLRRECQAAAR